MEENNALEAAFDQLSKMLSSEDGQKQISDILGMFSGGENGEDSPKDQGSEELNQTASQKSSSFDSDILKTATKLLRANSPGGKRDKNTVFLEALKPFLKEERQSKLDSAVKLMSAAALFKELGGLTKGGD